MVYEIRMPDLEEDADEASIVGWSVEVGTAVQSGDVLCEIEVGKSVQHVTSPGAGILRAIFHEEGTLLPPGSLIAVVADASDDISSIGPA